MTTNKLAPDWLYENEQPVRKEVDPTLDMTTTHKFSVQELYSFYHSAQPYTGTHQIREDRKVQDVIINFTQCFGSALF